MVTDAWQLKDWFCGHEEILLEREERKRKSERGRERGGGGERREREREREGGGDAAARNLGNEPEGSGCKKCHQQGCTNNPKTLLLCKSPTPHSQMLRDCASLGE